MASQHWRSVHKSFQRRALQWCDNGHAVDYRSDCLSQRKPISRRVHEHLRSSDSNVNRRHADSKPEDIDRLDQWQPDEALRRQYYRDPDAGELQSFGTGRHR